MSYFLEKCKNSPNLLVTKDRNSNRIKLLILGRGEDLFFQFNERSIFCVIDSVEYILYSKSIKVWEETREKITADERTKLIDSIITAYEKFYGTPLVVR